MKWFRSNIKHGSRLALFALAVQSALSFGHFHLLPATQAAPAVQSGLTQPDIANAKGIAAASDQAASPQQSPANHDPDQQSGDPCAICAVMAMASTVLFATPPLLLLPQAVEFIYLTTDAEFLHLKSASVAFQPRAPPRLLTSFG
jgi:hypothetical protein